MQIYNSTKWIDHAVDGQGNVIQEGTPQSAENFNNIENGVFESNATGAVLTQQVMQHKRSLADLEGERGQAALTNSEMFPFNNSVKTVAMSKARDSLNYRVSVEVASSDGEVGNIKITDKQLNGFKLAFTGSAKNVTLKYYIQGGMYQ